MNEPMDQLGNPKSKSIAFIKQYTKEIVTRYKNSPAVWGWELGNEYNLGIDLPNASDHRPWVWPDLGTATNRTARDELTSQQMLVVMDEFAKTVREYDKTRMISTGNAVPPWYAYHNTLNRSWDVDTVDQYKEILSRDNPNPFDTISVHIYPLKDKKYAARAKNISELIKVTQETAIKAKKPFFLGEFGCPISFGDEVKPVYTEFINAIEKFNVPLAALWVFDMEGQKKDWNVNFTNKRAFMLEEISKANKKINLQTN
jgi:endo-1,4-beta-mannosidase